MGGKLKVLIPVSIFVLLFVIIKPFVNISTKKINMSSQKWIDDILFLKEELPQKHKNLFANITKTKYDSLLNKLVTDIPNLNSNEIDIRLMEVFSLIGDGHTKILNFIDLNSPAYPIEAYWFQDGYYIVNASKEYKYLIGKKIVSINKKDITGIVKKLSTAITRDNSFGIPEQMPTLIRDPRILKAFKITDKDTCTFEFEDNDNTHKISVPLTPNKLSSIEFTENPAGRIAMLDSSNSEKLQYIKAHNTVYLRFDTCKVYDKLFSEALSKIKDEKAKSFIIDLRNNEGGTFIPNNTLIKGCKSIQGNVKIYIIVGRKTFSSAINYATSLKNDTNGVFYGEPTSGKPNSYGDIRTLTLPNSKFIISYSTKFFKTLDSNEESFLPNVYVDLSINDYLKNNDEILVKVLQDIGN